MLALFFNTHFSKHYGYAWVGKPSSVIDVLMRRSVTQASLQLLHVSIGLACISRLTIELGAVMVECLMQNWPIRLPPGRQEPLYTYQPQPQYQALCSAEERRGIVNVCKGEWSRLTWPFSLTYWES